MALYKLDSSDAINSDTLDDRMLHQETRIEKEGKYAVKNVVAQSIYEEKLANNGLYANIFMHSCVVLLAVIILVLKVRLIILYHNDDREKEKLSLGLFGLTVNLLQNKTSFSYFCIDDYEEISVPNTNITYERCTADSKCVDAGLNITMVNDFFKIDCSQLVQLRTIGIVVRIEKLYI
jgi:hypothetical protein